MRAKFLFVLLVTILFQFSLLSQKVVGDIDFGTSQLNLTKKQIEYINSKYVKIEKYINDTKSLKPMTYPDLMFKFRLRDLMFQEVFRYNMKGLEVGHHGLEMGIMKELPLSKRKVYYLSLDNSEIRDNTIFFYDDQGQLKRTRKYDDRLKKITTEYSEAKLNISDEYAKDSLLIKSVQISEREEKTVDISLSFYDSRRNLVNVGRVRTVDGVPDLKTNYSYKYYTNGLLEQKTEATTFSTFSSTDTITKYITYDVMIGEKEDTLIMTLSGHRKRALEKYTFVFDKSGKLIFEKEYNGDTFLYRYRGGFNYDDFSITEKVEEVYYDRYLKSYENLWSKFRGQNRIAKGRSEIPIFLFELFSNSQNLSRLIYFPSFEIIDIDCIVEDDSKVVNKVYLRENISIVGYGGDITKYKNFPRDNAQKMTTSFNSKLNSIRFGDFVGYYILIYDKVTQEWSIK